jgi:hypothetical protein
MRKTILFGGTNKERLVSVASAQSLHGTLPEADLWFWDVDDTVREVKSEALAGHDRPFEVDFTAPGRMIGKIEQAIDVARIEDRVMVLGLHGGRAENGELQVMCEMRGVPFTGSGAASSYIAFDKIAAKRFAALGGVRTSIAIALENVEEGLAEHGRLVAKPVCDGSSYGVISFEVDPRDLSGPLHARSRRAVEGQRNQGAPRVVMPRLHALRLHRISNGRGLSRDQHPAGPHQSLAASEGARSAGHRVRRFPERPDCTGHQIRPTVGPAD